MEPTDGETGSAEGVIERAPTGGPLADLVDAFAAAVTERLDEMIGVADHRDLAAALADLERASRAAEAACVAITADVDERLLFAADGHRSVRGWVLASVNIPGHQALRRAQTIRLFRDLPDLADLLASGGIGIAQVRELARANAAPRTGRFIPAAADYLIDSATSDDFDLFVVKLRELERLLDADGAHRDADQAHEHRNCRIDTVGDTVHLDGKFAAAQGSVLRAVFEAFVDAEYLADCEQARQQFGGGYSPTVLARTAAQRRADALVAMCHAAASAPLEGKSIDVCINVVVDATTFDEELAERLDPLRGYRGRTISPADGVAEHPCGASGGSRRRLCHTLDGTPLDPLDAVVAAFWGHIRRVVLGADGVIIDLGRRSRLFTGSCREAGLLQAGIDRFGRCLWPGCRLAHCQLDHTREWRDDGVTDVANSGPVCGHHNRFKASGYRTRRDALGHWHTYRPDGTEITAA